jgi:hypothetical protein
MDPLLLEALRFGVAILAGGIVAVIAQRIAFDHARQLQRDEAKQRADGLRRALLTEVDENIVRIGPVDGVQIPGPTVRTAWDQARTLPLGDDVLVLVSGAYREGALLNEALALFNQHFVTSSLMPNDQLALVRNSDLGSRARDRARRASAAFEAARDALKPLV